MNSFHIKHRTYQLTLSMMHTNRNILHFPRHLQEHMFLKMPLDAKAIVIHVVNKIKELHDRSLICKSRIAPHINNDNQKNDLRSYSTAFPPIEIRILLSLCPSLTFIVSQVDIKTVILHSGTAEVLLDVRSCYILFINADVKCQVHSDTTLLELRLIPEICMPQLFYFRVDSKLFLLSQK